MKCVLSAAATAICVIACFGDFPLDGIWQFRFDEGKSISEVADPAFKATDLMSVPGCYDMMPKWLCRRGTGQYRRKFTLGEAVSNAWLVVDGMGLTGRFAIDGRDIGTYPYPYALLEIETYRRERRRRELADHVVVVHTQDSQLVRYLDPSLGSDVQHVLRPMVYHGEQRAWLRKPAEPRP